MFDCILYTDFYLLSRMFVYFDTDKDKIIRSPKNCPIVNTELAELTRKYPGLNANILGVIREGKFVILKKKDKLKVDDKAFVVISASQIDLTLSAFGHEEKMSKKILIKTFEDEGSL